MECRKNPVRTMDFGRLTECQDAPELWESDGKLSFDYISYSRAAETCEANALDIESLSWLICRGGCLKL